MNSNRPLETHIYIYKCTIWHCWANFQWKFNWKCSRLIEQTKL